MKSLPTAIIKITGTITDQSADSFCAQLAAVERGRSVELRIDSPGGVVSGMVKMCSAIQRHSGKVSTICTNLAASAAGVLFLMGCDRRMVFEGAIMMHCASNRLGIDTAATKAFTDGCADIISIRTSIDRERIMAWMQDTTYFNCTHALHHNLATGIASDSLRTGREAYFNVVKAPRIVTDDELRIRRESSFNEMMRNRERRLASLRTRLQPAPVRSQPAPRSRPLIAVPAMPTSIRRSMELTASGTLKNHPALRSGPGSCIGQPF